MVAAVEKKMVQIPYDEQNSQSDESDDDEHDEAIAEGIADQIEAATEEDPSSFFFHIRCWCRSLQLVMNDVFKVTVVGSAVACLHRIVPLLQR